MNPYMFGSLLSQGRRTHNHKTRSIRYIRRTDALWQKAGIAVYCLDLRISDFSQSVDRRRTLSREQNILASSKPAIRRQSLLNLGKEKPPFHEIGLVEVATAGHVRAAYVPGTTMIVLDLGKLTQNYQPLVPGKECPGFIYYKPRTSIPGLFLCPWEEWGSQGQGDSDVVGLDDQCIH